MTLLCSPFSGKNEETSKKAELSVAQNESSLAESAAAMDKTGKIILLQIFLPLQLIFLGEIQKKIILLFTGSSNETSDDEVPEGCAMTPLVARVFAPLLNMTSATTNVGSGDVPFFHADGGFEEGLDEEQYLTASCGGPNCLTIDRPRGGEPESIPDINREPLRNHQLERRANSEKESCLFQTPFCRAGESISTNQGFRYKRAVRLPVGGGKFLVRGCSLDIHEQRLLGCKLICCGDWHYHPMTVRVRVPADGVNVNATIDHVCFTRLLEMDARDFWDEHEFHCDEEGAELCLKKIELFNKLKSSKQMTLLMSRPDRDNYLISAILM